jgi:YebC/PmpR family DNA-binding regulatory protein
MSGHSKWSQIKHKKAVTDARRGKLFTKLLKEVTVAARLGGGDPAGNARLRSAIAEAKASSVPKDNIERAIRKGTGELEGEAYEEAVFEGYGPGGVAVLVETVTDNRNRTVGDLRHAFSRCGGNLGENGCVAWMFDSRGCFGVPRSAMVEEELLRLALAVGAEDVRTESDELFEIETLPGDFHRVAEELDRRDVPVEIRQLAWIPQSTVALDRPHARQVLRLIEALEDHDDVQHVWTNLEPPAEPLEAED